MSVISNIKFPRIALLAACALFCCLLSQQTCSAVITQNGLDDRTLDRFSANNIMFYDPSACVNRSMTAGSCFRVDTTVTASEQWYAEGCLNNGGCTTGIYASTMFTNSDSPNHFLLSDTKIDENMGGMQYIYAENYDIEFDAYQGWIAKFTPNNKGSTQKYYWIVLPAEAYATGFGETYVATFENVSEPIYFITYDTHQCIHQSEAYCDQANADPNAVAIGKQFFGAFTKGGGNYTDVARILGKLKTFCRIRGKGEITVSESGSGSTSSNSTSSDSGTVIDTKKCEKLAELRKAMWNAASDADKQSFMKTVSEEVHSIAGVEIYMNQIISKHGSDGTLHDWLTRQCEAYRPASMTCTGSHTITSEEQGWIDQALEGSNNVRFAIGNATGGSNVGAGKIVCVWDGSSCRSDVDYTASGGTGACNVYSSSASYGECLGLEGEDSWVESISSQCDKNCNSFDGDYPQYYQWSYEQSDHENSDQDWTTIPYGSGNVSSSGCGPTSMAMLATVATGKDIYPQDIINLTKSTGSYTTSSPGPLDKIVGDEYGFEVVQETYSSKTDAYDKIKDYLNRGYMIHMSGEGNHAGFSNSNTAGHYVGIFKIDSNDNIWTANSSMANTQVKLQDYIDAIHNGVFVAIKGSGNSGGSCFDECGGSNGYVGDDGLTIEQAKVFMMNYGENKNDSSKNAVGSGMWDICNGGGSNCVTFSAFFIMKFTTIGSDGAWGDGQNVVPNLRARSSVEATFGTEPRVYAIISTPPQHTAVVLGHHDGKWIVGHASCSYTGIGKGNGGNGELNGAGDSKGGGSGYIAIEESDDPADWQWINSGYSFAYPNTVKTAEIGEYLSNGV